MLRSGKNGTVRTFVPACSARSADIYERYASGLYQQAFLTLGDSALGVHVVRDVIADECVLPPAPRRGEDGPRRAPGPTSHARPRAVNGTLMPG